MNINIILAGASGGLLGVLVAYFVAKKLVKRDERRIVNNAVKTIMKQDKDYYLRDEDGKLKKYDLKKDIQAQLDGKSPIGFEEPKKKKPEIKKVEPKTKKEKYLRKIKKKKK